MERIERGEQAHNFGGKRERSVFSAGMLGGGLGIAPLGDCGTLEGTEWPRDSATHSAGVWSKTLHYPMICRVSRIRYISLGSVQQPPGLRGCWKRGDCGHNSLPLI